MYIPLHHRSPGGSRQKNNLGYMFVNFIDTELACRFCVAVHGTSFAQKNSGPGPVYASIAAKQGRAQNLLSAHSSCTAARRMQSNAIWLRDGGEWLKIPMVVDTLEDRIRCEGILIPPKDVTPSQTRGGRPSQTRGGRPSQTSIIRAAGVAT